MTTLLAIGARRCDSRCHYAVGPTCRCICAGANHGVGLAGQLPQRDLPYPEKGEKDGPEGR